MFNRNNAIVLLLIAMLVGTWAVKTDRIELPNWLPSTQGVDRVTYVYEKDEGAVPRPVSYSLAELNKIGGIIATELEVDQETGIGGIPTQDKIAVDAAKAAGLPALVVQQGGAVVNLFKSPQTVADVATATGLPIKEPE